MHKVFYVLPLEQDITRKRQINENNAMKLDVGINVSKKYEFEAILNNIVYAKILANYLPGFYYLILQKGYIKEKNT